MGRDMGRAMYTHIYYYKWHTNLVSVTLLLFISLVSSVCLSCVHYHQLLWEESARKKKKKRRKRRSRRRRVWRGEEQKALGEEQKREAEEGKQGGGTEMEEHDRDRESRGPVEEPRTIQSNIYAYRDGKCVREKEGHKAQREREGLSNSITLKWPLHKDIPDALRTHQIQREGRG